MKTKLLSGRGPKGGEGIRIAARLLSDGNLVAFPTETVYGLGASIYHPRAIREIYRVKGRPADNPLIIHLWSIGQVHLLARSIPLMFWVLADRFMPGPLTIVLRKSQTLPALVTAGLRTVAIRLPDHPVARRLLKEAGVPIVAPSANISGRPSPTRAQHVLEDLDGKIAAVLDGGPCRIGVESTVLDITTPTPIILRPGGVPREEIEEALGIHVRTARPTRRKPASPGMKYKHYSPNAEVLVFEGEPGRVFHAMRRMQRQLLHTGKKVGVMASGLAGKRYPGSVYYSLGSTGPSGAARRLFHGLRTLDLERVDVILCQGLEEENIGTAFMNRLRKAASRRIRV